MSPESMTLESATAPHDEDPKSLGIPLTKGSESIYQLSLIDGTRQVANEYRLSAWTMQSLSLFSFCSAGK
jgi:hypothetical protein